MPNISIYLDMSNNRIVEQELVAEAFKALSNRHRLAIYQMLVDCCGGSGAFSCDIADDGSIPCVGDLAKELTIAQSTLSHHLKEMSHAKLITMERRGKQVVCAINQETYKALGVFFSNKNAGGNCS